MQTRKASSTATGGVPSSSAKQRGDADRAAAQRGEDDLFGQTATARMKHGTAKRCTPGWVEAMVQAKGQAERYAKALPVGHGWPPFLMRW